MKNALFLASLFFGSFTLPFTFLPAYAEPYCLAVRGNGESVAAHWPAMARIVEENGLPEATSGGSSGSISLFLLDSLAASPVLKNESDPVKRRHMAALFLKSMPAFINQMAVQDGLVDLYSFLRKLKSQDSEIVQRLSKALGQKTLPNEQELMGVFGKYALLVNPAMIQGLLSQPAFFKKEAQDALKFIAHFDARDPNLFLRPGMVDFHYFALLLGSMGDFYAGNTEESVARDLGKFAKECGEASYQKPWKDISPACADKFKNALAPYLGSRKFSNEAIFQPVGSHMRSFPSTSIVSGSAASRFQDLSKSYRAAEKGDYAGFQANYAAGEVSFGYWGSDEDLSRIQQGLEIFRRAGDEKSRRFKALGQGTWFDVLSTSPAEPGLASLQRIPNNTSKAKALSELRKPLSQRWEGLDYRQGIISAGGWSDLHPMALLRAAGCEHIIYVTRRDGDSVFSQQTFIRLSGTKSQVPFWETLEEKNNDGWPGVSDSAPWNQLFNLANSKSSFQRALRLADAVYCTDWNRFRVFDGEMDKMTEESYTSPVFLAPTAPAGFKLNGAPSSPSHRNYPGCLSSPE